MYILKINFKSINKLNNLKQKLLKIKKLNKFKSIKINGFFKVKKKKKIFTILKSPNVYKKSREHFIYDNYNQKINIKFFNIFQLFSFILIIKKILSKDSIINLKILKK